MRDHDIRELTASELERARRELAASLALARPGSPVRVPILARIGAIDTEMIARTAQAYPAPGPARRPRTGRMQPRRCRPHPEEPEVHHSTMVDSLASLGLSTVKKRPRGTSSAQPPGPHRRHGTRAVPKNVAICCPSAVRVS